MSRSYKKTPVAKDHDSGKFGKKMANRRVRRTKEAIPNGKAYRRCYESYDIHDHISRYSRSDWEASRNREEKHIENGIRTRRYVMNEHDWAKYFRRK